MRKRKTPVWVFFYATYVFNNSAIFLSLSLAFGTDHLTISSVFRFFSTCTPDIPRLRNFFGGNHCVACNILVTVS